MIELHHLDIDLDLAEQIQAQRRLNPRDRSGRGWQSRTYTGQPFAWFDSVYQQVTAQEGVVDSWWFNVSTHREYTNWHAHHRWAKVAVLYVAVPGGDIEFKQSAAYWTETPKSGDLFVFPGSLEHRVLPNYSDDVRISVAFNFKN
jgi:hypothetical protein